MLLISLRKIFYILLLVVISGCTHRNQPAPVEELRWRPVSSRANMHIVKPGETLYAVAFRYDQDYRNLAKLNHLHRPYTLKVGQRIWLHQYNLHARPHYHKPLPRYIMPVKSRPVRSQSNSIRPLSGWQWPAQGKVVTYFSPAQSKKGIDIAGNKGNKIYAAASGIVAYSGGGLLGYGNLIIIKHEHEFLTAYGNNSKNLVKEGQKVKVGQVIAEMGVVDRKYWGVHFEMRRAGNPVNPLNYLRRG